MEDLRQKWPSYVADLFDPSSPARFYLGWNGDVGASNIPANIIDQFSRPHIAYALIRQFGRNHQFKGSLLDFGCGTAAVSLSWQVTCANQSGLLLSDFENLPREFVRYYIKKYPRFRRELVDIDLKEIPDYSIDGILCIHVLEHLPNPTTLFKLISSKLKTGGIFIVEAPWGGHPEHLKEAPTDWNEEGGKELLSTEYTMLKKMNPYVSLSGVYKKK